MESGAHPQGRGFHLPLPNHALDLLKSDRALPSPSQRQRVRYETVWFSRLCLDLGDSVFQAAFDSILWKDTVWWIQKPHTICETPPCSTGVNNVFPETERGATRKSTGMVSEWGT